MYLDNDKIEALLADRMMKNVELAQATGLPLTTLNRAERGENVTPITAGKIARALGVSAKEIQKEA
jgi:DNA-binding Xre family transcriptional regulator